MTIASNDRNTQLSIWVRGHITQLRFFFYLEHWLLVFFSLFLLDLKEDVEKSGMYIKFTRIY